MKSYKQAKVRIPTAKGSVPFKDRSKYDRKQRTPNDFWKETVALGDQGDSEGFSLSKKQLSFPFLLITLP